MPSVHSDVYWHERHPAPNNVKVRVSVSNPIPAVKPTDLFLWSLCAEYSREFPDPKRPIRSELVAAFTPRVVRLLTLKLYAAQILSGVNNLFEKFFHAQKAIRSAANNSACEILEQNIRELVSQIVELDSWLHQAGTDEIGCGNWLTARGYSFEEVLDLTKKAKKYQQGRRPAKRLITVAALEARRLDGSRSWSNLAKEFCDCGKSQHYDLCSEALRKSAAQLESALKKYREIPVPVDLLAPLSNIFLDQLGWKHSS
jgi:hypothetical protein